MHNQEAFVHLRVHSAYSISEGASKIPALIKRNVELGIPAFALTDRNNIFGVLEFSDEASKAGIQPIIGIETFVDIKDNIKGSVILLAMNEQGYKNICFLLRESGQMVKGKNGKLIAPELPSITCELLSEHHEGIILLTGNSQDGLMGKVVSLGKDQDIEMANWLLSIFGTRLYMEICRNGQLTEEEAVLEDRLIDIAYGMVGETLCLDGVTRNSIPLVATTDVWYTDAYKHKAWLLLKAVESNTSVTIDALEGEYDLKRRFHLRAADEMREMFSDLPEAWQNTSSIAQRCSFAVRGRAPILPPFACEGGRTESEELRAMSLHGLKLRLEKAGINEQQHYWERLDYELSVIENMGFPGYFLIVADFIQWTRQQGIPVGPGRGSGAGSVVAWALTITDLNPLEFGLLFERFLNPERISMPDFDIDFCQDRRGEVMNYVRTRYGEERVAQIATFGVIKSKSALTSMQRVLFHSEHGRLGFGEIKDITKMIPKKKDSAEPMDLQEVYTELKDFKDKIDASEKLTIAFECALSIEGLLGNSGSHAAGLVIGDRPLDQLIPIMIDPRSGKGVAGLNMKGVEKAGLVKFDFLGLTTLSIMNECLIHIKRMHNIDVDISAISKTDAECMKNFARGATTGVFQFESKGMRDALRKVKANRLEDLIAVNALYRPGPMDQIDSYAKRKNGEEEVPYPQPIEKTKPFLEETYGIMVYQEQVMQVARESAGYSLGGADMLRRAMGKKDKDEMTRQKKVFIHGNPDAKPPVPGAVSLGMTPKVADELFDDIQKFADYGFNKSHAAAYAWIGYQTMWLKTKYPAEYLAALLSYQSKPEKMAPIKDEMDEIGIRLLPPDVNYSSGRFIPEREPSGRISVRFGLGAIKRVPQDLSAMVTERERNGKFKSLEDFHKRVGYMFNKGQYEKMAEAGAFSSISKSRMQAHSVLTWLVDHKEKSKAPAGQMSLLGEAVIKVPDNIINVGEWGNLVDREFKSVGFYFVSHPIDRYIKRLKGTSVRPRKLFEKYLNSQNLDVLQKRYIAVMVDDVKFRQTKTTGTSYVEVAVSERGDAYYVSCYKPFKGAKDPGMEIDEFRAIFQAAKTDRKPIVIEVSLKRGKEGKGIFVNGHRAWDIDKFLETAGGLKGIVVGIDESGLTAKAISMNDPSYNIRMSEALILEQEGQLEEARALRERALDSLMNRIAERISNRMDLKLKGNTKECVPVVIEWKTGHKLLTGNYLITEEIKDLIKSTNGVVSIKEKEMEQYASSGLLEADEILDDD